MLELYDSWRNKFFASSRAVLQREILARNSRCLRVYVMERTHLRRWALLEDVRLKTRNQSSVKILVAGGAQCVLS
jgi:hypothetical protein